MSNRYGKYTSRGMRNLRSAGMTGLNFAAKAVEKSSVGLFRWAATDHSGMTKALVNMPAMGILDSLRYICMYFVFCVAYALFRVALVFFKIAWILFLLYVFI